MGKNNEPYPKPQTLHKNYLKIYHILKYKTVKLLKVNKRENLQDLGLDEVFSDMDTKARSIPKKIWSIEFMKIKNFAL